LAQSGCVKMTSNSYVTHNRTQNMLNAWHRAMRDGGAVLKWILETTHVKLQSCTQIEVILGRVLEYRVRFGHKLRKAAAAQGRNLLNKPEMVVERTSTSVGNRCSVPKRVRRHCSRRVPFPAADLQHMKNPRRPGLATKCQVRSAELSILKWKHMDVTECESMRMTYSEGIDIGSQGQQGVWLVALAR
jgi:hypothetical protein